MATIQGTSPALRIPLIGKCGDRRIVRAWAVIPDDDFGRSVLGRRWRLSTVGYACRKKPRPQQDYIFLHRVVYAHYVGTIPDGKEIDHIDRDPLNNLPANLRAVTRSQNLANRARYRNNKSGFTGVFWNSQKGKWAAKIMVRYRVIHLGCYSHSRDAAVAVNRAYAEHHPHVPPPNQVPDD